jgi:MFS family permease
MQSDLPPQPKRQFLPALPRNVWAATLTSFLTDISSEMIFNLLPLFLANVLGASTAIIGLIEGIAETTSSLLKGFSGWLSDKWGSRKGLTTTGYALSTAAKPFLYLASSWAGVLLVRFADRVGKGIRTSPRDALIADSVDAHQRGAAFGLHRAGDTAGALIGIVIALVVVLAMQAQATTLSRETFQTLILISIVPAALAVLVMLVGVRETRRKRSGDSSVSLRLGDLNPDYRLFLGIMALFTLGNSADAFLILRAQERGLSVAGVLIMLIAFNLIYSVFASPLGSLSDRIGRKRLLIGGWLVYSAIYLGFGAATTALHIALLYGLYGLYYAAVEGTAKAYVADLVLPEQRGSAYGYFNATVGLMALPASLLAGILWQGVGTWAGFGASAPFIAGAALALLAAILLLTRMRGDSQPAATG